MQNRKRDTDVLFLKMEIYLFCSTVSFCCKMKWISCCCCSVAKLCLTVSDSLWPRGLQHSGFPCPSLSPGSCSDSYPLSRWCYLTISSTAAPLFCLQSFPAWGSFPVIWLFTSGSQSIASAEALQMNIQCWFPWGLTGLISLRSKGSSRIFSSTTIQRHQFFSTQPFFWSNFHNRTWLLEKP